MASRRDFHLLDVNSGGARSTTTTNLSRKPPSVVPDGVSYLDRDDAGELRIATDPAKQSIAKQFVLEAIWSGRQSQLLLTSPPGARVLVNGRVTPQLYLLSAGDLFQADDDHLLYVLLFNRPDIGPAGARRVGLECPVCRSKFGADTRVYTCLNCGTAIHFQGDETPLEERLDCILAVSTCPACSAKINLADGYSSDPEAYFG